jgi:C4-type Zn-finger protein
MWNTEEQYFDALKKISKNCPSCKGELMIIEYQSHPYGDTVVWESYEVPCQTCERRLCNVQQYYIANKTCFNF